MSKRIAVLGCGPAPLIIQVLSNLGHDVLGVESINEYVKYANEYLKGQGKVDLLRERHGTC